MATNELPPSSDKNWLDPLRKNSWEMELLITGFVLIGLLQLPESIDNWWSHYMMGRSQGGLFNTFISVFAMVLITGIRIIIINLVVLLLLRGFWIGIIGLTSAFPKGIQLTQLNFSDRFTKQLQAGTLDTESLIYKLDNWCSSIFALSFLFLFATISLGLFLLELLLLGGFRDQIDVYTPSGSFIEILWDIISFTFIGFFFLGGILKFIDYATAAALKRIKNKWWSRFYFPISQFVSYTTLGFLYRPIYYFFISNINRKLIVGVFLIYMTTMLTLFMNIGFRNSQIYYPYNWRDNYELSNTEYENLRSDPNEVITDDMIQSDVIKDGYIKLFLYYNIDDNNHLKERCPTINQLQQDVSSNIDINIANQSVFYPRDITEEHVESALDCFSNYYKIMVNDSVYSNQTYIFHRHRFNDEPGLLTYISVDDLPTGFHKLAIYRGEEEDPNLIQFWKQ